MASGGNFFLKIKYCMFLIDFQLYIVLDVWHTKLTHRIICLLFVG
jgi:hypothetical protein